MSSDKKRQPTDPLELESYLERLEAYQDSLDPEVERLVDSLGRWQFDSELQPRSAFVDELAHELQVKGRGTAARKTKRKPLRSMARLLAAAAAVAAVVFLLVYAGGLFAPPEPEPAVSERALAGQSYTFYLYDSFVATKLVPLDPQTLNDQPDGETLEPGGIFSTDGSTQVDIEYPEGRDVNSPNLNPADIWIVVRDLQSRAERSRFHPPVIGLISALSENGGRLVIKPYPPSSIAEWYVVDTTNGQLLVHIKDDSNSCSQELFDLTVQKRIYCVADPDIPEADGPEPMRFVVYDINSGTKTDEIEVPEALLGRWDTRRGTLTVWKFLTPAVVLSPDGHQIAVVHADADKITLIDTQNLTVERTFSLSRRRSLMDLFTPRIVYAKGEQEGTIRQAVFSPRGRYLYIFTQEVWLVTGDAPTQRGLRLVDLEQETIVAEALPEYQVQWVQPAPDGTVYVFGTTDERLLPYEIRASSPSTLWRLDGLTLEILAARVFAGYRAGRLVPALTLPRPALTHTPSSSSICPISPTEQIWSGTGPVAGEFPVWMTSRGQQSVTFLSADPSKPEQVSEGVRSRALLLVDEDVTGDLVITGRQLDGPGQVYFFHREGDDTWKPQQVILDAHTSVIHEKPSGRVQHFIAWGVTNPGCYQLTFTLAEYTVPIVVEVIEVPASTPTPTSHQ